MDCSVCKAPGMCICAEIDKPVVYNLNDSPISGGRPMSWEELAQQELDRLVPSKADKDLFAKTNQVRQVYDLLMAGKKVTLNFPGVKEKESFRVGLAQIKSRIDKSLVSIGYMEARDVYVLSCENLSSDMEPHRYRFSFSPPKPLTNYPLIVEG